MRRIALLFGLVGLLSAATPAAQAAVAVSGPGGFVAGFATPVVVIAEGEGVTFQSFDVAPHNFVADGAYLSKKAAKKQKWCTAFEGKCPLFWSPQITAGESTEVQGLEALKSGDQYGFFCTVHPNMKGTLVVR
jgi:plastocyanin